MPLLEKIDVSNFIIKVSKDQQEQFLKSGQGAKFLDTLFVNVVRENTSLYFYKCVDIIYTVKLFSGVRFIRNMGDFWFKTEDLLLRMKKDFSIRQIVDIVELYASL
jgi:hypothetical protein